MCYCVALLLIGLAKLFFFFVLLISFWKTLITQMAY